MHNHKRQKQQSRSKGHYRDKILSPNLLRTAKNKLKSDRKALQKPIKKSDLKSSTRINEISIKHNLFNSLQDLPITKQSKNRKNKKRKSRKILCSNNNIEDSTASRELKNDVKQYNHPNKEYFGTKLSSEGKKERKGKFNSLSKGKSLKNEKIGSPLQKKIKYYRRLSSQHRSQSQSLNSQLSDQEMHRLKKVQSIEKMVLMEEILTLESKRLHIKTDK